MSKSELYEYIKDKQDRVEIIKQATDNARELFILDGRKNGYELMLIKLETAEDLKDFVDFVKDLHRGYSNLLISKGIKESAGFIIAWLRMRIPERLHEKYDLD